MMEKQITSLVNLVIPPAHYHGWKIWVTEHLSDMYCALNLALSLHILMIITMMVYRISGHCLHRLMKVLYFLPTKATDSLINNRCCAFHRFTVHRLLN